MSALTSLKEFSGCWTAVWVRLLKESDKDILNKTPKGSAKAIAQLETGAFFLVLAMSIVNSRLPVDRKMVVEDWVAGDLMPYGKTLDDLRANPTAYSNTIKRVTKMVDTLTGHLKVYGLIKINAGKTYALTKLGQEVFEELGG